MDAIEEEIWRLVPPEEKFEMMAHAQARGVFAASVNIIIMCTIAVGLKLGWLMWFGFIICPFVFQFAAGKAWRNVRPRTLLEYLAARSASRRFAFTVRSKELMPQIMFKGTLEKLYDQDHVQEAMEAIISNNKESQVWVTLFGDAITMIQEYPGGATVKFAALIDKKMTISSLSEEDDDYNGKKVLKLSHTDKDGNKSDYILKSKYPAALVVFEKKAINIQSKAIEHFEIPEIIKNKIQTPNKSSDEDDAYDNLFSF